MAYEHIKHKVKGGAEGEGAFAEKRSATFGSR